MNRRSASHAARGFTLIELMVSVAIVGMLSSVAIPSYSRMTLRAKAAERPAIMNAIAVAVGETATSREPQGFPVNPMTGPWNPAVVPGSTKRVMDWTLGDWNRIPMIVEGATYHSYQWVALDNAGGPAAIVVSARGDLDVDGAQSLKIATYTGLGYSFMLTAEWPPAGDPLNELF